MSAQILIAFLAACLLLAVTPGPNMALILANTLRHGRRAGLATLAGTSSGLSLLAAGAVLGMSSLMVFLSEWFDAIRWAGALYLIYLGTRQLFSLRRGAGHGGATAFPAHGGWYVQGLLVSLSNPKVLLFLGAFLPQFLVAGADPVRQLAVLAMLFVGTLTLFDVLCTLAAARAQAGLMARRGLLDGVAGGLLLLGGMALAMVRRP